MKPVFAWINGGAPGAGCAWTKCAKKNITHINITAENLLAPTLSMFIYLSPEFLNLFLHMQNQPCPSFLFQLVCIFSAKQFSE